MSYLLFPTGPSLWAYEGALSLKLEVGGPHVEEMCAKGG